jgi:putative IMPACT (imprinted ancient) family translation regulator
VVAQIDEQHAAVIAHAMHPAGEPHGLADVAVAQRAAGMGSVAMHGIEARFYGPIGAGPSNRAHKRMRRAALSSRKVTRRMED